jgi:hypothetical protein
VFTVREEIGTAFTMTDGKVAETYMEYLYDKLPHIAEHINDLHKDKLGVYIDHVLGKLNELIPDLEYVSSINGTNNNIINALVAMINFFKSYTTDLRNLNIMYYLDDKFYNKIRMVDDPRLFIKLFPEIKALKYHDNLKLFIGIDRKDRVLILSQKEITNVLLYDNREENFIHANNVIESFSKNMEMYEDMDLDYADVINIIYKLLNVNNKIKTYDEKYLSDGIDINSTIDNYDKGHLNTTLSEEDYIKSVYSDSVTDTINESTKDKIRVRDAITIIREE